ncbi:MAG: protease complex subunit PrcB family protein [Cyanobacteriota bacterium]|nr:protease complex subunit PrcB family protein [Cyanobacteriota bacterium]
MTRNSISKHSNLLSIVLSIITLQLWLFFPDRALADFALSESTIAQTPPETSIPFSTLDRGSYAGIDEPFAQTIGDAASWEIFWNQLQGNLVPIPSVPDVDFTEKEILAVGMGQRNSGGYYIEVESVAIEAGTVEVSFRETTNSCGIATMALTQPYHLVVIDRLDFPVRFIRETEEIECSR